MSLPSEEPRSSRGTDMLGVRGGGRDSSWVGVVFMPALTCEMAFFQGREGDSWQLRPSACPHQAGPAKRGLTSHLGPLCTWKGD